jgi:hypothetical protein
MTSINRSNEYSAGIRRLTEEKLREYIEKPESFHDEAILAAIWELRNRRKLLSDENSLEARLTERLIPVVAEKGEIVIPEPVSNLSVLPSLYSIRSIQVFSVLFSVIAGGILMAINFNRTTRKNEAFKVLGFSIAYTLISFLIFSLLGTQSPFLTIILNLLGAFLIDQLFWKRVLGSEYRFNNQPVWTALIVALLLSAPLIWYVIKSGALETI